MRRNFVFCRATIIAFVFVLFLIICYKLPLSFSWTECIATAFLICVPLCVLALYFFGPKSAVEENLNFHGWLYAQLTPTKILYFVKRILLPSSLICFFFYFVPFHYVLITLVVLLAITCLLGMLPR